MGKFLRNHRFFGGCAHGLTVRRDCARCGQECRERPPDDSRIRNANHRAFLRGAVDGRNPQRSMALAFKRRIHHRRVRTGWNYVRIQGALAYAPSDGLCRGAYGLDLVFDFSSSCVRSTHGGRDRLRRLSFAVAVPDRRRISLPAVHRDPQCMGRGHLHHARTAERPAEFLTPWRPLDIYSTYFSTSSLEFTMYRPILLAFCFVFIILVPAFAAESADNAVTFARDVAPILQERCQECHHKGSIAPMSLVTYDETRPWAKAIRERVIQRQMPPWHIDKNVGVQKFKNDMSLTDDQISTIVRWVDSGAPLGDLKDMPAPKQFSEANEWKGQKDLGPPDLVVKSEPYTMAAKHQDVWWRPLSNIPLTEPRWLRAVEIRPGTLAGRRITHHAVAYLAQDDPDALAPGGDPALNARAYLMEWAVGKGYDLHGTDAGKLILPGAQIAWDV